jgi:glycosyltransferase involved in cell wall biosynthesis/GT2 family glycosyltransferase
LEENGHSEALAKSRRALLEEIGGGRDVTFVRGIGNVGDELIWAGTRGLLEGREYREIGVEALPSCSGETVLLSGSGAWCRSYHEWMPRALAIAELRFERVIVLPSSFEITAEPVLRALERTDATVFAREPESLGAIQPVCRARLAHDCAFFYDFSGYSVAGAGTLAAFRTDREATGGELVALDNDDISLTSPTLLAWLDKIERHALIRTDRAHVMIAAALMGKQVEFAPSNYHKVDAIAAWSLRDFPVRRIDVPCRLGSLNGSLPTFGAATRERLRAAAVAPPPTPDTGEQTRVTAVVLSHDRPEFVWSAVRSVTAAPTPVRVLVIDNDAEEATRRVLDELAAADPRIEVHVAERNLGCAGGRRLAVELVDTELVLFLDDDAELIPGALEHMLAELDAHPEAVGVTPLVVDDYAKVFHFGGSIAPSPGAVAFTLTGGGLPFDDPSIARSGPTGWVPGTASLLRTEALRQFPIDQSLSYYEDNDWCHRVEQSRPGSFRRRREALVLHHSRAWPAGGTPFVQCSERVERLAAQADFMRANGVLLDVDLGQIVPELRRRDGSTDLATARQLLELISSRGTDWVTMAWINGELAPLLGPYGPETELRAATRASSFRDSAHDGSGLTVTLEQDSILGGMERIAQVVLARWPAATLVAPHFAREPHSGLFPDAVRVELPGHREQFLAPLHARRLEQATVLDGEVVLALHSSGWALGPRAAPGVPVIAFTNGPPRWTGPLAPYYLRDRSWPVRVAMLAALPLLREHQRRLRRRADLVLACSQYAASQLPEQARVIHSPVDVTRFSGEGDPGGHVLVVGRQVAHKRFDLVVRAMRGRPERLIVVGDGPELGRLTRTAPPNVTFAGNVDDDELAALLHGARALVHPMPEEFGIVMAEAQAAGVPVIAPRAGGALEIVRDGVTGRLLEIVTPATIGAALDSLVHDPEACRAAAAPFAAERFVDQLGAALDAVRGRTAPERAVA